MKKIVLLITLIAISGNLHCEEIRYISDVLVVQLRTGPTFNNRNFKGLTTGTRLTLLETTDDGKWARVRTSGGDEGWVPTQYLSTEPAARDVLKSVQSKLDSVEQQNTELKSQLADITSKEQQAKSQLAKASDQSDKLGSELEHIKAVSSNAIELDKNNKRLLQENQVLKNKVDVLTTQNQRLNDAKKNQAFMNGAFAVLIGVFITLLVPRLWPRKRSEWA